MARYKLHCFCQSGNSYKAALYLNCAGLDWEPVFVDYFKGATRDAKWRESVNETGEAPVLETDGRKLAQSGVILTFLEGRFDAAATIVDRHLAKSSFMVGDKPTIADFSLAGYVYYPVEEHGYDWAKTHPNIHAWMGRMSALPGWKGPYELMPGQRMKPLR